MERSAVQSRCSRHTFHRCALPSSSDNDNLLGHCSAAALSKLVLVTKQENEFHEGAGHG